MRLCLIDLDRTLLDTDLFESHMVEGLSRITNLSPSKLRDSMQNFHSGEGILHYFDGLAFVKSLRVSLDKFDLEIKRLNAQGSTLYEDGVDLMRWMAKQDNWVVQIITFGQPDFQKLKIVQHPELTKFKVHYVEGIKSVYIKERLSKEQGCVIDDKKIIGLPNGWHQYLIDRSSNCDVVQLSDTCWMVNDLRNIKRSFIR